MIKRAFALGPDASTAAANSEAATPVRPAPGAGRSRSTLAATIGSLGVCRPHALAPCARAPCWRCGGRLAGPAVGSGAKACFHRRHGATPQVLGEKRAAGPIRYPSDRHDPQSSGTRLHANAGLPRGRGDQARGTQGRRRRPQQHARCRRRRQLVLPAPQRQQAEPDPQPEDRREEKSCSSR